MGFENNGENQVEAEQTIYEETTADATNAWPGQTAWCHTHQMSKKRCGC